MKLFFKIAFLVVASAVCGLCKAEVASLKISGFVTDRRFQPVEGATVTIVGSRAKAGAITDSEGAFIVILASGVEEGHTLRIHVQKSGYKPYQKLISASSAIPLRISLESIRVKESGPKSKSQNPIERTESFSTLVPFHGEWRDTPIPMNWNLSDPHKEYYDELANLANRPEKRPDGWPSYKARKFESLDEQYAFVTRLDEFELFRSIYFLQKGVSGGIKWVAGVGVTPIDKKPIAPPDASEYPQTELFAELSGNEFLNPMVQMQWKNRPPSFPVGTHLSFLEESNPQKGQVLTCTVRLERPGYFRLDFAVQSGLGMNNHLPAGFQTEVVNGTTTYAVNIAMHYTIQNRRDHGFQPEKYAAWADSLFSNLKANMGFETTPDSANLMGNSSLSAKEGDAVVFLDCKVMALPIPFPSNSTIYVLDTQTFTGLEQFFSTLKASASFWPSPDTFGDFAYRCEFTNYSDDPIFGVSMVFKVSLLETSRDEHGAWRGTPNVTASHDHVVEITKVDAHGGTFIFYVVDGGRQFAEVIAPEFVSLELARNTNRSQIRLKQPSGQGPQRMRISPRQEFLK